MFAKLGEPNRRIKVPIQVLGVSESGYCVVPLPRAQERVVAAGRSGSASWQHLSKIYVKPAITNCGPEGCNVHVHPTWNRQLRGGSEREPVRHPDSGSNGLGSECVAQALLLALHSWQDACQSGQRWCASVFDVREGERACEVGVGAVNGVAERDVLAVFDVGVAVGGQREEPSNPAE